MIQYVHQKGMVIIMSKASMDNIRVKKQITEGLFPLLRKKPFSEITVTDIVKLGFRCTFV